MTLQQLTKIIKTADKKAIVAEFKLLGYIDCNHSRKLGKVSVVDLIKAVKYETEDFDDKSHKHLYNGRICGNIKGYEKFEFIYINVYYIKASTNPFDDEETAMQTEMLIWAKEITR